jgi:hypothetical protein
MVRQQLFHLSYLIVIRRLPCLLKNMSVNQYPIQTLLTGLNLRNRDSGDSAAFRLGATKVRDYWIRFLTDYRSAIRLRGVTPQ